MTRGPYNQGDLSQPATTTWYTELQELKRQFKVMQDSFSEVVAHSLSHKPLHIDWEARFNASKDVINGVHQEVRELQESVTYIRDMVARFTEFKTHIENQWATEKQRNVKALGMLQSLLEKYEAKLNDLSADKSAGPSILKADDPAAATTIQDKARTILKSEDDIFRKLERMDHKFGEVWSRLGMIQDAVEGSRRLIEAIEGDTQKLNYSSGLDWPSVECETANEATAMRNPLKRIEKKLDFLESRLKSLDKGEDRP